MRLSNPPQKLEKLNAAAAKNIELRGGRSDATVRGSGGHVSGEESIVNDRVMRNIRRAAARRGLRQKPWRGSERLNSRPLTASRCASKKGGAHLRLMSSDDFANGGDYEDAQVVCVRLGEVRAGRCAQPSFSNSLVSLFRGSRAHFARSTANHFAKARG